MVVQHLSLSDQHFTPPHVIEAARRLMGGIELDPASCDRANVIVKAERYFTKEVPATQAINWYCKSAWLNPPGGLDPFGGSNQKWWFEKLLSSYRLGRVQQACFLSFNLEFQRMCPEMFEFPYLIFSHRLHYFSWHDGFGKLIQGQWNKDKTKWTDAPSHASMLVYLPPKLTGKTIAAYNLSKEFQGIGKAYLSNHTNYADHEN